MRDAAFLSKDDEISDIHTDFAKFSARKCAALAYAEGRQFEDSLSVSDILIQRKDHLLKVAFIRCKFTFKYVDLDLSNYSGIEVLLLDGNKGLETLNLGGNTLRYVDIQFLEALHVRGLNAHVKALAMESKMVSCNKSHEDFSLPTINFGRLQVFELSGLRLRLWKVPARRFKECVALEFVQLHNVELGNALELSSWPRVKKLNLSNLPNLKTMHNLQRLERLRELKLAHLINLTNLSGISSLSQLEHFEVDKCTELLELHLPCSLKQININSCDGLTTIVVGTSDLASKEGMRKLCDMLSQCNVDAESTDEDESFSKNCFSVYSCKNLMEINGLSKLTSIYDFYFDPAKEMGKFLKLRRVEREENELSFRCEGPRCDIPLLIS